MRNFSIARSLLLTGFLTALALNPIVAQQPTQAERDAIRSACRSDFLAHCANVQPGGKEAFDCLLQNDSKLSASCKSAVNAAVPKPEPLAREPVTAAPEAPAVGVSTKAAASQAQQDQVKTIRQTCTLDDFVAHCSWIQPSSPEVMLCLKANATGLSPACRTAVESLSITASPVETSPAEPGRKQPPATQSEKPMEPAHTSVSPSSLTTTNTPQKPTAQQTNAIRAACRSDFVSRCSGVQPGGAKALQCLQRNAARLSPPCKSAVAVITGGATGSPSAAPSENVTSSAIAPLTPMPTLRPREALAILRICGEDTRSLCAGVPSGGGHIISCLAERASSLSPRCYGALAAARKY